MLRTGLGPLIQALYLESFNSPFARKDMTLEHVVAVACGPSIAFTQFVFEGERLAGVGPAKVLEVPEIGKVCYRNAAAIRRAAQAQGVYSRLIRMPLSKGFEAGPFRALACMTQNVHVWQAWDRLPGRLFPMPGWDPTYRVLNFARWYETNVLRSIEGLGQGYL